MTFAQMSRKTFALLQQKIELPHRRFHPLLDVQVRIVLQASHGAFDAAQAKLQRSLSGFLAIAIVLDPGEGDDGPDADDADLTVGMVEVWKPRG